MKFTSEIVNRLGNLYLNHPGDSLTAEQVKEFEAYIDDAYAKLPVSVEFVERWDPYENVEEMTSEVHRTGTLYVSSLGSSSPITDDAHNLKFRAIHDWIHIQCGADFSAGGEHDAYLNQIILTKPSSLVSCILYSEIVLQACAYFALGETFPEEQKLVLTLH